MKMKLKSYPKYKESGIDWIGKIPEGWEVYRLKFLLSSLESGSRETGGGNQLDKGVFSVGGEHINWDGTLNLENTKLISEKYYHLMNKGKLKINDVLLVKDGATIGKTAILIKKEFKKMAVNEHVFLMRSNKRIDPKLLYYLICGDFGFKQIKLTEVGSAQGGINQDFIAKVYFSIPEDKQEQIAIANFLDKKTAKIDTMIEKDKKLIELLKERRDSLINHAVTKGLDLNARMKDSGIDWIGEIPEGWEVVKLKYNIYEKKTKDIAKNPSTKFIGLTHIESETGKLISSSTLEEIDGESVRFKENNVLFGKLRPYLAKVIKVDFRGSCTGELIVYEVGENVDSKFLFYRLLSKSFIDLVNSTTYGVKMPRADPTQLSNIKIAWPPHLKQIAIANFLDKATAKIDKIIKLIEKKIKLLEEYKKSLIHHVVTGKVEVREVEV